MDKIGCGENDDEDDGDNDVVINTAGITEPTAETKRDLCAKSTLL